MAELVPAEVAAAAAQSPFVHQVAGLLRWVGAGRKLTATGALTLADARILVEALGTGDEMDPRIGEATFRTKTSAELLNLGLIVAWARAAGLVRTVKGRLVPVKKSAALIEDPPGLWLRLFEVFPRLEPAFLPPGWGESFLRAQFTVGAEVLLSALHTHPGAAGLDELNDRTWQAVTARYALGHTSEVHLETARRCNDRDVRRTLATLTRLGAVTMTEESAALTPAGRYASGSRRGELHRTHGALR